jgi:DNA-binding transcriptional ArsR family regulator
MPETLETADEIKSIRFKIEAIESTQELLLRERAPHMRREILEVFARTPLLDVVYLAVNGQRSQAEIVDALAANGVAISQPTVSRRMDRLEQEGLIEKAGVGGRGVVWSKKAVVERTLQLSRHLQAGQKENGT